MSHSYQRQLSLAVERERSLERDKVQLELDWQRRCESAERDQYQRSEELIQGLSTAREQVCAPGPSSCPAAGHPDPHGGLGFSPT